jgi:hypothetical protein
MRSCALNSDMAKGFKSGGRRKGSLNIGTRSLGRKRERVRRDATVAINEAMPHLRRWLAAEETWKSDGAQAARMLDGLMKWVLPSYGKIDPHAEQAEQAAVERAEPPPVRPADILAAFHTLQKQADKPAASVPQALETGSDPARLSDTESEIIRHSGIPLAQPGHAYLPKPPLMPKRPEPGAMPEMPKPPIDAESEESLGEMPAAPKPRMRILADSMRLSDGLTDEERRWAAQMRTLGR